MHGSFELDHLVITAPSLESGLAYAQDALGVKIPKGGAHPDMGTHNHLLGLGGGAYLEVIAPNPAAPKPTRPRAFALDMCTAPRLAHWVVRTSDMTAALATFGDMTGPAIALSRGPLHWRLTVPEDGALPLDGAFPSMIEWPDGTGPANQISSNGCVLDRLTIRTAHASALDPILAAMTDPRVRVIEAAHTALNAQISTANGLKSL